MCLVYCRSGSRGLGTSPCLGSRYLEQAESDLEAFRGLRVKGDPGQIDRAAFDWSLNQIDSGDSTIRQEWTGNTGRVGKRDPAHAVGELRDHYRLGSAKERSLIIEVLGRVGTGVYGGDSLVLAALRDTCPDVRAAAIETAYFLVPQISSLRSLVERGLHDPSSQARRAAVSVLRRELMGSAYRTGPAVFDTTQALTRLLEAMADSSAIVREEAARSIGTRRPYAAQRRPAILRACRDSDPGVRRTAVGTLMDFEPRDEEIQWALLAALGDSSEEVRRPALFLLGLPGPLEAETVTGLARAARDPREPLWAESVSSLSQLAEAHPALWDTLAAIYPSCRTSAQKEQIIGTKVPPERLFPILESAVRDSSAAVRRAAASALGASGSGRAEERVALLIQALADRDLDVRLRALDSLGDLGGLASAAIPALHRAAYSDSLPVIRGTARAAIKSIKGVR